MMETLVVKGLTRNLLQISLMLSELFQNKFVKKLFEMSKQV